MSRMKSFLNKIICGDCIEIMRQIPDCSIDIIITSPPYNAGKDYGVYKDSLPYDEYFDFVSKWLKECFRILVDTGRICINIPLTANNPQLLKSYGLLVFLPQYYVILQDIGFTVRELIVWIKTNDVDGATKWEHSFCGNNTQWGSWLSPSSPYLRSFSEFILVASKGEWKLKKKGETDLRKEEFMRWTRNVWAFPSCHNKNHPAPFPVELPYRLIKLKK